MNLQANLALKQAIDAKNLDAMRASIAQGADVNAFVPQGIDDERFLSYSISAFINEALMTPEAVAQQDPIAFNAVKLLLDAGANPCLYDYEPERLGPLFSALLDNASNIMRLLLDYGADPYNEMGVNNTDFISHAYFDYWINVDQIFDGAHQVIFNKFNNESMDEWLRLDTMTNYAKQHGFITPDCCRVLLEYDAQHKRLWFE